MRNTPLIASALCACMVLGGCGGGGGGGGHHGSGGGGGSGTQSPGGIWKGTDSLTGLTLEGLVTENGQFLFIRADGTQYLGNVTTSGTSGTGTFDGFAPFGTTFADGSNHGTGTISGTIQQRSSFVATTQFTTDGGTAVSDSMSMTFKSLYNQPSSLATIAGNYTNTTTGTVYSIDANGVLFAQDATTGCVQNGVVSIINASYDAYGIGISYASCTGVYAVLNGLTLTGLATLDTSVTPELAIFGIGSASGATKIAVTLALSRS